MVDGSNTVDSEQLGHLSFLIKGLEVVGIELSLMTILIVMLTFFSIKGIMKFFESYNKVLYQQYFMKKIRISNINNLANFSYDNFVKSDSGKIQNTFSGEVLKVSKAYNSYFTAVQYGVLVVVYVFLAFLSNPEFAILVTIGGLITNLIFKGLYSKTKKISKQLTLQNHTFQGLLIQKVGFFKYLKASGLITNYAKKLKSNINEIENSQRKMGFISSLLQAVREPLVILVVVVVILIQVELFSENLGLIILSLLFLYRSLTFVMAMQKYWNDFLTNSGSLENMTNFTRELETGKEKHGKIAFQKFINKISLKGVSYSYDDTQILKEINLDISKNEIVAIVGESGSGKTTLINLLSGLQTPSTGQVIIDDYNLNELNTHTYQNRTGYITQEPVIFNDTIFNNVTFWDKKNDFNLIRFYSALKRASIDTFVKTQPNQEDELLGNNGINISGGQKQRLSIARELYKEVDILFMDEATSALDSETEKAIQENIDTLKGELTIIIIAHRLSTIRNADRIVMLNNGRIEHVGSFEDLRSASPNFKRIVELQGI